MNFDCKSQNQSEYSNEQERNRAVYANKIYCLISKDKGIDICTWKDFAAWRDYVVGQIDETELLARAETEIRDFPGKFTGYNVSEKQAEADGPDSKRVKLANKMYRKLCASSGLNLCFFNNFSAWSSYVNGQMDEDTFIENAKLDIQRMLEEKKE
jgi:hypothetical protein